MSDISYQVSLAVALRQTIEATKMNQDVNVLHDHSAASKRVFKFHNVNQDNIFAGRRNRREENKKAIIMSCPSIEEQMRRRKAEQILQQFVPIKQKSVENKGILAPVQTQIISAGSKEDRRDSEPGGLRLVNIASLQEPSDLGKSEKSPNICLPQSSSIPNRFQQESPLDLSNKDGCEGPLDLTTKPEGKNIRPALSVEDKASPEPSSPPPPPSSNQPIHFLLLKNVPGKPTNSFLNLQPSSFSPSGVIRQNNLREKQCSELEDHLKLEISESGKIKKQQSIQMVLSDGRVVEVLPRKTGGKDRISDGREGKHSSSYSGVKLRKDPNQNEVKQPVKKKKGSGPDLMVKTNETVTKNGDLFCTFKNVKHIKMLKEQQSRKTQKKSKKSS